MTEASDQTAGWSADEVTLLKETLAELLTKKCSMKVVRTAESTGMSYAADLWETLGALGFLGLPLEPNVGGMGAPWAVTMAIQEDLGRALAPAPVVPAIFLAAHLIQRSGTAEMRTEWLPRILNGSCVVTAPAGPDPFGAPPKFKPGPRGPELRGTVRHLPLVEAAEIAALVAVDPGGEAYLCLVSPLSDGFTPAPAKGIDGERLWDVKLADVPVAACSPLRQADLAEVLGLARLGHAAWMVGVGQGALDLAVAYSKERHQFGRPIGSFQGLQHQMATAAMHLEVARQLVAAAAAVVDRGGAAELSGRAARMLAAGACMAAVRTGMQVYGGYGYVIEADIQLYYRRAARAAFTLGDPTGDSAHLGALALQRPDLVGGLIGQDTAKHAGRGGVRA